jgi:DNA gyrase/topoisomerase IV subunit B
VREELLHFFNRNKDIATKIVEKVTDTQQLRKELQEVKKLARERAKAITIRIPQLKDCKNHFDKAKGKGKGTMVFLCEGQSASGSITSCRDVNNQAVFTLKGKPLNVWDLKRDIVYKNDEMYNLMRALDIEDNIEHLRYDKVILATDADVDGLHIRNLLITYFFKFFEPLVHDGHLYVLETPLFRVRNKQETIYCYSEGERDAASTKLAASRRSRASRAGRNFPERVQAIHRQGNAPEPGGIRAQGGQPANPDFLHGQEHARAEGLHYGEPGRAGGGVTRCARNSKSQTHQNPECRRGLRAARLQSDKFETQSRLTYIRNGYSVAPCQRPRLTHL